MDAWHCRQAPLPSFPAATWWVSAHAASDRGSSAVLCIVWHEKQLSVRLSSVALAKQGESMSPLYSRPDTRTIPSGQKESARYPGYAWRMARIVGASAFLVGWTTKRVFERSSPGRYRRPSTLARRSAASSKCSHTAWHCPHTWDETAGFSRGGCTMALFTSPVRYCLYRRSWLPLRRTCSAAGPWHASQAM